MRSSASAHADSSAPPCRRPAPRAHSRTRTERSPRVRLAMPPRRVSSRHDTRPRDFDSRCEHRCDPHRQRCGHRHARRAAELLSVVALGSRFVVVPADNACNSESKDFVRTCDAACAAVATVTEPRDTSGTALARRREPCPRDGGQILKALAMGVCALFLLVLPATAQSQSDADLGAQLTRHLSTMKKDKQVLTFLQNHQWLFSDPRFSASAKRQKRIHTLSLARTQKRAAAAKAALAHRQKVRRLAAVPGGDPEQRHLPRLRRPLPGGTAGLALRVRPHDHRPERPVPRPVPDGLERAAHLRPRLDGDRAGDGRAQVLRRLGPQLGPVVVQALELAAPLDAKVSSAKCGTRRAGRVPTAGADVVGVPL